MCPPGLGAYPLGLHINVDAFFVRAFIAAELLFNKVHISQFRIYCHSFLHFFFHFQLPIRALCWTCSFIFWSTVNWCWAQLNNHSIENRYSRQSNGGIIIQNCKRQIWCSPSIIFLSSFHLLYYELWLTVIQKKTSSWLIIAAVIRLNDSWICIQFWQNWIPVA